MTMPDPTSQLSREDRARACVQALTAEEFKRHRTWVALEEPRRRDQIEGQVGMYRQMRESGVFPTPSPEGEWQAPDGVARVYLPGDQVAHGGRVWESIYHGLNEEQPGEGLGWEDITPPQEPEGEDEPIAAAREAEKAAEAAAQAAFAAQADANDEAQESEPESGAES